MADYKQLRFLKGKKKKKKSVPERKMEKILKGKKKKKNDTKVT